MAQDYKVQDVKDTGQTDDHGNSKLWISLEGMQDNAFMVAKNRPEIGAVEHGELVKQTSKAGKEYYRFKRVQREEGQTFHSNVSRDKKEWKDNSSSIEAQSAVKSAAQVFAGTGASFQEVEKMARQLHDLIGELSHPKADGVYQGQTGSSGYEKAKAAAKAIKEDLPPVDSYNTIVEEIDDSPIDLSEIPF